MGDLEIDDVKFAYPSRKDVTVLNNVNIEVRSREIVALVGSSGSGKSSIM